jgi:hypothetical protein
MSCGSAATGRGSGCRSENRAPRGGRGDTLDAIQRQKLAALELANAQAREPDLKFNDDSFKRAFWAAGQMWRAETLCKSRYFVSFVDDGIRSVEDTRPEQHQRDSLSRGRHRPRRYFLATRDPALGVVMAVALDKTAAGRVRIGGWISSQAELACLRRSRHLGLRPRASQAHNFTVNPRTARCAAQMLHNTCGRNKLRDAEQHPATEPAPKGCGHPASVAVSGAQPRLSRSISVSTATCGSENSQVPPASHEEPSRQPSTSSMDAGRFTSAIQVKFKIVSAQDL